MVLIVIVKRSPRRKYGTHLCQGVFVWGLSVCLGFLSRESLSRGSLSSGVSVRETCWCEALREWFAVASGELPV